MFALHNPKPNVATHTHAIAPAAVSAPTTNTPAAIANAPTTIMLLRAKVALYPRASKRSELAPPSNLPKSTVKYGIQPNIPISFSVKPRPLFK